MPEKFGVGVQEAAAPSKGKSSISECDSGSDSQDAFLSQELPGEAGAAIVTIPKAEKDVDDFDVRFVFLNARVRRASVAPWAELAVCSLSHKERS